MTRINEAKKARQKWVERLAWQEKELKRLPKAIESTRAYIAHWEKVILGYEESHADR